MKKIVTLGIVSILALGLTGCNWFQSPAPADRQPTVTETTDTTPVSEEFTYENSQYNFSLTFPSNWGKVKATTSTQALMNDAKANVVTLISEKDSDRNVKVTVVNAADKSDVGDLPATLLGENSDYIFYFNNSGEYFDMPDVDPKFETIFNEAKVIESSFKMM